MTTDLGFMRDAAQWPLWPVLPVKQRKTGRIGVMREEADASGVAAPCVYLVNLFDLQGKSWAELEHVDYPNLESLVDDGWVVD